MSTKVERLVQNDYSRLFVCVRYDLLVVYLTGDENPSRRYNPLTLQSFKHPQGSSYVHTEEDCAFTIYKNMGRFVL